MRFVKNENGSVTIEFVLWLPVVLLLILTVVDATFAFIGMGNMWQVSRETARIVSRYGMEETAAETWAASQGTFTKSIPDVDVAFETGDVIVTMSTPIHSLTPFGMLSFGTDYAYVTQVRHSMEPL